MNSFIHADFCLETEVAQNLYHNYAANQPIIDYHCHLSPQEIAEDKCWDNITQVWLYGDHYKWRAMRSNGVSERLCTGDASDREKFSAWAATVPATLRNPLYHWTHLELKKYFGYEKLLSPKTEDEVWNLSLERMSEESFSARGLMKSSGVELVCTTDDPIDSLEHHIAIKNDPTFDIQVLPTWRPDKGMAVENAGEFNQWLDALAQRSNIDITNFDSYMTALNKQHDFFHQVGCRLSDHGIETAYALDYTDQEIKMIFDEIRSGKELSELKILKFKSAMLYHFGVMDAAKGWTQQYHLGAIRNNNSRLFKSLGPDTGFDSIGDFDLARPLAKLLDRLDSNNQLAKTILYNLNPRDNEVLATMIGNFQDGSVAGKMQLGSGWWFLDQMEGMTRQIEALSQLGLLSRFVGMLTDSRSFLSYTRHDYFRRILCNILGNDVKRGLLPNDTDLLGSMVRDISYNNAENYFGFDL
ncbi:glucuronate isomerase [Lentisphaera araneosa HTCC2155]|uniref:Uronate isomerase n=1 Tax=Lentisphaera araneosa HTCC2155 TaxID=313628 RepID=A6DQX4_9BACT|nr:glucuronate isomerase [Lentisphaera araneosa]EDM26024.1 glucuronate isomerase [Lentisphaera araneosa HTCC2155]